MTQIESNILIVAITLTFGILLASAGVTTSLAGAASGNMSKAGQATSGNMSKAGQANGSTKGSNQTSQSKPAKPAATANQLEQMGNNSAFLQGSASVGKKPNLAVGLSKEQNTTAGPSKANMTAQKKSGSAGSSSNATSTNPSGNMS